MLLNNISKQNDNGMESWEIALIYLVLENFWEAYCQYYYSELLGAYKCNTLILSLCLYIEKIIREIFQTRFGKDGGV